MKIKNSATNYAETANASRIVIFSLTGEKVFAGQTVSGVEAHRFHLDRPRVVRGAGTDR